MGKGGRPVPGIKTYLEPKFPMLVQFAMLRVGDWSLSLKMTSKLFLVHCGKVVICFYYSTFCHFVIYVTFETLLVI